MKKFLPLVILLTLLSAFFMTRAYSAEKNEIANNVYAMANSEDPNTAIYPQTALDGSYYLFLPSASDLKNLTLYSDADYSAITLTADESLTVSPGEAFDLTSLFTETERDEYPLTVSAEASDGEVHKTDLTVMKSAKVRSMYLVSEDPVNNGRAWVDSSKSNEAEGLISLIAADGTVDYTNKLTQLKARGNSSFTDFTKKAYQIKIDKKAALIDGCSDKSKKWVLLANAADITLIHNTATFFLANELNMPYTPSCEPIDLYYDGEYRGSYLLAEKIEVDETRVDIQDLDEIIEEENKGTDAYENPVVVTKTRESGGETDANTDSAGSYKYVQGLSEPSLGKGQTHHAYLIELEFIYRYPNEQSGFVTDRGQAVVTKNPEYLTKGTGAFISGFFQDFEDAVFSPNGYNESTGKYYYEYCDLESLVNIYLIHEYAKNYDSFRSSAFFYLPEDEDIMYAGPVWDYDICYGTGYNGNRQIAANPENFFASTKYMLSTLITIESFRDAVKDALSSDGGRFYNAAQKLLGEDGKISEFSSAVYESQKMNYKLWNIKDNVITALFCTDEVTYENGVVFFEYFAENRLEWLSSVTSEWSGSSYSAPTDPSFQSIYRYHAGLVRTERIEPTFTESGYTEGCYCEDCGTVFTPRTEIPALTRKMGDINGDGKVTASDARLLLRISASLEELTDDALEYGDFNSDGRITAADARVNLRLSAGLEININY